MNEMLKKSLPIGSVVIIDNVEMMIVGYSAKTQDGKKYDYMGFLYPVGRLSEEVYLFNKVDIKKIIFIGYQGLNYFKFKDELEKIESGLTTNA